jgi:hypothetical protein
VVGQLFAKLADAKLGKDLEANPPRLFAERSARLLPNADSEYAEPRAFGYGVATVATPELLLRFVRTPEEFSVQISAPGAAPDWKPLDCSTADWATLDARLVSHRT